MRDAIVTRNPDEELPVPSKWVDFYYETPGDSQGSLLVMVQLIPQEGRTIPRPLKNNITPATRKAYIELILIGIRDMAPYNFQAMTAPFLELELNSFGSSYLSTTQSSKRPTPDNPNFLEKIIMPVQLPEHSIFCSPLQVRVIYLCCCQFVRSSSCISSHYFAICVSSLCSTFAILHRKIISSPLLFSP